jgi:hypothetical protein
VVALVHADGKVWTLFATGGVDSPSPPALYLHGPLRHPTP